VRYVVQTFGCQMNVHDSRRIEEVLDAAGWEPTEDVQLADLVLFNTCSVREKAEQKLLSVLGTVRGIKEERPGLVVAVAGCVAQQEGDKLLKRAPHLDVVIGPDNIAELPALVQHIQGGGPPVARTVFDLDAPAFLTARPRAERELTSFVTVMKGCDERCTFCIVPTTRGPERYRAADDVIQEIAGMVAGGTQEVTLLGQTVNSWYEPREGAGEGTASEFAQLLRRIAREVPDLSRLRYTSPHPRHLTPELIAAHAELSVLPAHVHLPVQSGSNRMLKRMLRRYTREEYVQRVTALRDAVRAARHEELTLSSDFIVGFPGETEEDFEETLSLVREVRFSAAFAFKYSPRPHTPALKLGDDVTEAQKDDRLARLFAVVAEQQTAHLTSLVGSDATVLIEGHSKVPASETVAEGTQRWRGRTQRHEIVHLDAPTDRDLTGHLFPVRIRQANAHSLVGTLSVGLDALPMRQAAVPTPVARGAFRLPILGAASRALS
jgi:tRNA-2-methylthio-N6-dimethylallyladenosine synthase